MMGSHCSSLKLAFKELLIYLPRMRRSKFHLARLNPIFNFLFGQVSKVLDISNRLLKLFLPVQIK